MRPPVAIEMEWDGVTTSAALLVNGTLLIGSPRDVQNVFNTLNRLRGACDESDAQLRAVKDALSQIVERL